MVKNKEKETNKLVKEELTEIADGKVIRTFTEKEEEDLIAFEGANWCNATKAAMKGGLPFFILKKRCAYISNLISSVNPECSKICKKAIKAKDWNDFSVLCTKSTALWNKLMSEKNTQSEPWVV